MAIGKDVFLLAERLGYTFSDITYLECAVTHSSYANERRARGISFASNERMEFLGDAVLQLVVSEYFYRNFKRFAEGKLTVLRQKTVCEKTLVRIAQSVELGSYLHLGNGGEKSGQRNQPSVLANAMEAVFGAIYLDCMQKGVQTYKDVILRLVCETVEDFSPKADPKSLLKQLVEQDGSADLEYRLVHEEGPDNSKHFTVELFVNNNLVGEGEGRTIKDAEMQAAEVALALFGVK